MSKSRTRSARRRTRSPRAESPAARLRESERLFRDFCALTPYRYRETGRPQDQADLDRLGQLRK